MKWQLINILSRYVLATFYDKKQAEEALKEVNSNFDSPRYELAETKRTR